MNNIDNRGFAISTMLYSLLIMVLLIVALLMGIMSNNRQNTKGLVQTIEEELNRYSLTTTTFNRSSNDAQTFNVPVGKSGWYKIELWGASGASNGNVSGGRGSYTSGIIYLEENTYLYFYIGGMGNGSTGGLNGGGNGNGTGKGGGGATDVRLLNGPQDDYSSLKSRIMVAAGGSGATSEAGQPGGLIEGYENKEAGYGRGGRTNKGGRGLDTNNDGSFRKGGEGVTGGSGGGAGYFGGSGGSNGKTGGGGSSFIYGYAGVSYENVKFDGITTFNHGPISDSNLPYFINGMMAENANVGDGKAKIELISMNDKNTPPVKKNTVLASNTITQIKDCVNGISGNNTPDWKKIEVISKGKVLETTETVSGNCKTIILNSPSQIDEIGVYHVGTDVISSANRVLNGHTLSVSSNGSSWQTLISAGDNPETLSGIHISAWNQDYNTELSNGTYYIFSSNSPNTGALTAVNSNDDDNSNALTRLVKLAPINGSNLQKWVIIAIGNGYYRIVERESNQALQIVDNLAQDGTNINTSSNYDDSYDWTTATDTDSDPYSWMQWKIMPNSDGTYIIQPKRQPSGYTTYLSTFNNSFNNIDDRVILTRFTSGAVRNQQRFYIVRAE